MSGRRAIRSEGSPAGTSATMSSSEKGRAARQILRNGRAQQQLQGIARLLQLALIGLDVDARVSTWPSDWRRSSSLLAPASKVALFRS